MRRSHFFGFWKNILYSLFFRIILIISGTISTLKRYRWWATSFLFIIISVTWILLMILDLPIDFIVSISTKILINFHWSLNIRSFWMQYSFSNYTGLIPLRIWWFFSTLPSYVFFILLIIYNNLILRILSVLIFYLIVFIIRCLQVITLKQLIQTNILNTFIRCLTLTYVFSKCNFSLKRFWMIC